MSSQNIESAEFEARVRGLEQLSARRPRDYKLRVLGWALFGYGFLFFVLFLLLAGVVGLVLLALSGKHLYVVVKLGIPLLIICGLLIRALWVRIPAPAGLELSRADAPELFAQLDAIRKQLRGPRIHTVLLDGDFNAGVVQIPRLGIFGWQKNYLMLGLPLLQALSARQLRAVLGHEYGHLAGSHNKFSGWIYRVRKTWHQLMESLAAREGWLIALFIKFFRWYAPFFSAYTFVLARANEYQADRAGAEVSSTREAADALINVNLKQRFLAERYWPAIHARTAEMAQPDVAPHRLMGERFARAHDDEQTGDWLQQAMSEQTDSDDTHPALADRLRALGEKPRVPAPAQVSAARELLGEHWQEWVARVDEHWREGVRDAWRERHEEIHSAKQRLQDLDERVARGESLELQQAWERATLTEEIADADTALPLYQDLIIRAPTDAAPYVAVGRILLDRNDAQGIALLEKAMSIDHEYTRGACQLLFRHYQRAGQETEAETCRAKFLAYDEKADAAERERAELTEKDRLQPHQLSDQDLNDLRDQLQRYPRVSTAFVARKALLHFPEKPLFVLGICLPWWYYSLQGGQALAQRIARDVAFPGEAFVVPLNGHRVAKWLKIGKRIRQIPGALIYRRR